jgi:hypothetical protein
MNLFADALRSASQAIQASASETITYRRGSLSASIQAVRAGISVPDGGGEIVANADVVDWLIEPANLVLDQNEVQPQRSDQIVDASGQVYDLLPGNPSDFSDSFETYHRIHTVRRGNVPSE